MNQTDKQNNQLTREKHALLVEITDHRGCHQSTHTTSQQGCRRWV